jgi:hypothetical protein
MPVLQSGEELMHLKQLHEIAMGEWSEKSLPAIEWAIKTLEGTMFTPEKLCRLEQIQRKPGLEREERDLLAEVIEIMRRIACSRAIKGDLPRSGPETDKEAS